MSEDEMLEELLKGIQPERRSYARPFFRALIDRSPSMELLKIVLPVSTAIVRYGNWMDIISNMRASEIVNEIIRHCEAREEAILQISKIEAPEGIDIFAEYLLGLAFGLADVLSRPKPNII